MNRINSLIFIEDDTKKNSRAYIKCLCDCGEQKVLRKDLFNSGRQKTCGKCCKKENLKRKRFGSLIVVELLPKDERFGRYWKCKCDCGNNIEARSYDLLKEIKTACPQCNVRVDLTGKDFGKLKVIKKAYKKDYQVFWECECKCGEKVEIPTYSLTKGYTKSCGCLKKRCRQDSPLWKGYGEISRQHWNTIKTKAHSRKLDFEIDIEYAWNLFLKQKRKCALSGVIVKFPVKSYKTKKARTASLDRIDNTKGYVKGNVQWLHKDINIMKKTHTQKYFIDICKKIANFK